MKKIGALAGLFLFAILAGGCFLHPMVSNQGITLRHSSANAHSQVLVVYYSHSGNTRRAAENLASLLQGDLYEIKPATSYPALPALAHLRSSAEEQFSWLPDLAGPLPDLSGYQLVLIGGPGWRDKVARPLVSWLALNDLSGKKVAPFWTSDGDADAYAADFAAQLAPVPAKGLKLSPAGNLTDAALQELLVDWLVRSQLVPLAAQMGE